MATTAAATKKKTTAKAKKARPVEKLRDFKRTVTSVSVEANINRDESGAVKLPSGKGGVRFNEVGEGLLGSVYVAQDKWAKLGKPESIKVTVEVA